MPKSVSIFICIFLAVCVSNFHQILCSEDAAQLVVDTLALENCDPLKMRIACLLNPYRSIDGTCNNLCNISRGSIQQPLRRFPGLNPPTEFEGENLPRRLAKRGNELPNARKVSRTVFRSNTGDENGPPHQSHMVVTWGQFLDHDVTLTELTEGVDCGGNNERCVRNISACFGIDILKGNQLQFNPEAQCIPLRRSRVSTTGEQFNAITSYIDGSQVYGSELELSLRLRDTNAKLGLLKVIPHVDSNGEPILPPADDEAFCRSPNPEVEHCFLAGDIRVNENQALMAMHTIWVREHNRIALALHVLNPEWDDERLYQEARKIVIAQLQHITYNEWLPALFDVDVLNRTGLLLEQGNQTFTGYDPSVDPTIINSFATAALRMGHTLIRNDFILLNDLYQARGFGDPTAIPVSDFFNPFRLFQPGPNVYGGLMVGLNGRSMQRFDRIFVPNIRERLIIEGDIVGDLPAINIQRGRDHGLPGYVRFREACGGNPVNSFTDLQDTTTLNKIRDLQEAYDNFSDIDLFAGGIMESPLPGSQIGFTFTCILTAQFHDLRFGDRFWYERDDHQIGFTLPQLIEIRKSTLARVICDNADGVGRINQNVFINFGRVVIDCDEVSFVNLNVFKEDLPELTEETVESETQTVSV